MLRDYPYVGSHSALYWAALLIYGGGSSRAKMELDAVNSSIADWPLEDLLKASELSQSLVDLLFHGRVGEVEVERSRVRLCAEKALAENNGQCLLELILQCDDVELRANEKVRASQVGLDLGSPQVDA